MLQKRFNLSKPLGVRADFWLVVILFLTYSLLYSLLAVIRHNHFQSQGIDFSIYDQALWLYSRLESPFSTVTGLHDLADRFRPIMLPLSSLYWFTQNERIIFIFQSVILSAAVFPIWLLARRLVPPILALVIAFLYVDFVGVQGAAVYDFHEMAVLPFFLAWLFYFLEKCAWKSYFVTLILCLTVREHLGLMLATLSVYIYWVKKKRAVAITTFLMSAIWSILAIKVIMPALGQRDYTSFVKSGESLEQSLVGYLRNPFSAVSNFFFPFEKAATIFWSFFSYGAIAILYKPILPVITFVFASRFLDLMHPVRWTLFYHYNLETAVLLAVATIYAARKLIRRYNIGIITLSVFLVIAHLTSNAILDSPLKNLVKSAFWHDESWMTDTRQILSQVPPNASVQSQNNLLPHLSHRKKIYLLPELKGADYIIYDLHEGQNSWNFYTSNLEGAKQQMSALVLGGQYRILLSSGWVFLVQNLH